MLRFLKLDSRSQWKEALTGLLTEVLELSRHSSHIYTNEQIPVTCIMSYKD